LTYEKQERLREYVEQINQYGDEYRITRAIMRLAEPVTFGACLEEEVSRECAKRLGISPRGILIPTGLRFGQRALTTTAGAGGQLVFTQAGSLIELLRNATQVGKLGARIISGLIGGPVIFPKQLTAGTLSWVQESPGSDVADSDLTTGAATLTPKSAVSTTAYSRQLLAQSSIDVEALVRADLVAVNAQGIDKAAIQGAGTLEPLGILGTTGIGLVEIGADGGYPTADHLQDLQSKVFAANSRIDSLGFLTTPGVKGYFRKTLRIPSSSFPVFIWQETRPDELQGYRAYASNNVPSTLTKGSKSDCHAIILGNWSDLIIGEWGVVEIIVDPYRLKKQAVIEITSFIMVDVTLRHPEAFAAIKDARIVA
jgi:HK97 family phage major capsid protein